MGHGLCKSGFVLGLNKTAISLKTTEKKKTLPTLNIYPVIVFLGALQQFYPNPWNFIEFPMNFFELFFRIYCKLYKTPRIFLNFYKFLFVEVLARLVADFEHSIKLFLFTRIERIAA